MLGGRRAKAAAFISIAAPDNHAGIQLRRSALVA